MAEVLTKESLLSQLDTLQEAVSDKVLQLQSTAEGISQDLVNIISLINNGTIMDKVETVFEDAEVVSSDNEEVIEDSKPGDFVFRWGNKCRDWTLEAIYKDEPGYLKWVCESWKDEDVRTIARAYADSVNLEYRK